MKTRGNIQVEKPEVFQWKFFFSYKNDFPFFIIIKLFLQFIKKVNEKEKKLFPRFGVCWKLLRTQRKQKKNEILLQSTQETAVLQKAPHLKLTKRKIWL